MELRAFAERVVLSTSLEEKLRDPGAVTDLAPGHSPAEIALPGRPDELQLQHLEGAPKPPGEHLLNNERERGILLHFLANHELLATELMALVLLKFPNAPAAFRQGVFETLKEEQAHTRLYLNRMKECGVAFGEVPLSGYFWRAVAPMESPIDFVARLSLTFEQANLDYSKYYAARFKEAGDRSTAAILDAIYHDEIGHVQHGLKWFRKWKDQSDTDWEAFRKVLHFPLSPARAKATVDAFNDEGRREAGLDAEFVQQLKLFRQSRGRPPTVYWFNPAAEEEIAGRSSSATMRQVCCDLESLMLHLARHEDVVLMHALPSEAFNTRLIDAGFTLPEILLLPEDETHPLKERKIAGFCPWARTPTTDQTVALLGAKPDTSEDYQRAFRKSWAIEMCRAWMTEQEPPSGCGGEELLGVTLASPDELDHALSNAATNASLFKVELGTSGRGQRRFSANATPSQRDRDWVRSSMQGQPGAILEPELERVLDLSFQFNLTTDEGLRFLGWTRPLTAEGRRFTGTVLGQPFTDLGGELKRFLLANRYQRLWEVVNWLQPKLEQALANIGHRGAVGVDALVYRTAGGDLKIKPVVEINPRHTMGHVALRLEKRLAPGRLGQFRIFTQNDMRSLGFADFASYDTSLSKAHPVIQNPDGRILSGFVPLADAATTKRLFPVLLVGNELLGATSKPH